MKCITCQAEIPPAWVACIQANSCPGCGGPIMDESAKELLVQLRESMAKMPNDPEGLAGWLMSTYDLYPKGSVEPTGFHRKPVGEVSEQMVGGALKRANTPINQFMKRAGADKILKNPKLAAIAQAINNVNDIDGQMYGDVEQEIQVDPEAEAEEQRQLTEMAARAKAQGKRFTMKEALANTVEFNMGGTAQPLSEEETEMMKHIVGGPDSDNEMEELRSLPPALQADRMKRLAAQRELKFGGASGFIKRSG